MCQHLNAENDKFMRSMKSLFKYYSEPLRGK